jgi:hypothetical protein
MLKLACRSGNEWIPHSFSPVFTIEALSAEKYRLVAGVPDGDSSVLLKLAECLAPPFFVLYVLHTPRGEGEAGRYQSPELDLAPLKALISRFSAFLAADARFDLWIHSPQSNGTLVWDRHNLIYGYGPTKAFSEALSALGFSEGMPIVPGPHRHHYREEFDDEASALLSEFRWQYSPLRPEDQQ